MHDVGVTLLRYSAPPDSDDLNYGDDEDDEASPEVVHQLENGLTPWSDVDRANSEANEADYAGDDCLKKPAVMYSHRASNCQVVALYIIIYI